MHLRNFAALLLLLCSCLPGCDFHFTHFHRSGPIDDDYVGEPLTEDVKQYEPALERCNEFVRRLKKGEYASIDAELCGAPLHDGFGARGLEALDKDAVAHFGAMKEYKPLQWGFGPSIENGRRLLCSVKIVEYERGKICFTFVFEDDGKYEKVVGLHTSEWRRPGVPGK